MPDEIEVVALGVGSIQGNTENTGTINGEANTVVGSIAGAIAEDANLSGSVRIDADMAGSIPTTGNLAAVNNSKAATSATLSVKFGVDGIDGKDGFSPTITVSKDTPTEYILKVTNKDGSYLTPNLYPDLEGLQDIKTLVASKVDEDLKEYPVLNPVQLNASQRNESYLYTNAMGLNRKIKMSDVSLEIETIDKIKKKLQTVSDVPERKDWKLSDYILLDIVPQDS